MNCGQVCEENVGEEEEEGMSEKFCDSHDGI